MHAAVRADDVPLDVADRAAAAPPAALPLDERGVIAVRHEADLVAVRLVGDRQIRARARASRTAALSSAPTGNIACASCACVSVNRKYD